MAFCAFCYAWGERNLSRCSKCHKRLFCSKECQMLDWENGHKRWCGIAGEIGFDFEVLETEDGKGLGVFAKRMFTRNEKVMVERALIVRQGSEFSPPVVPPAARDAVKQLLPENGNILEKIMRNGMGIGDEEDGRSGLFVTMSRVNNNCIGNAHHYFSARWNVKMLIASTEILPGEEITFAYVWNRAAYRKIKHQEVYSFECRCPVCCGESHLKLEDDLGRLHRQHGHDRERSSKRKTYSVPV
eukprot:GHVN01033912.1.p1 GENE.GHVN01033912.1~~GHVN01033912.1.p1  ORF type:complete len:243 (-),score=12.25 GHVN01033912.1:421-1149(-)